MRREPLAKSDAQHRLAAVKQVTAAHGFSDKCRYTSMNGKEPVGSKREIPCHIIQIDWRDRLDDTDVVILYKGTVATDGGSTRAGTSDEKSSHHD